MNAELTAAFAALFPLAVLFAPLLLDSLERRLLAPPAAAAVDDIEPA